jgi:protein required for attachment to host cells
MSKIDITDHKEDEVNQILADSSADYLTEAEMYQALAGAVKEKLSSKEIDAIYKKAIPQGKVSDAEIEEILIKAAQRALGDIREKNYHSIAMNTADGIKEIIDLGLSIYGHGLHIKVAFSL